MKNLILFIGLLLTFNNLNAQEKVTKNTNSSGIENVFVHVKFANNIEIKQWKKNEISVEATVNIDDNTHNDYFKLEADKIGKTLTINSDYGDYFKKFRSYTSYNSNDNNSKNQFQNIVNYVIYVPEKMNLKVKSISGSVAAASYNGFLELDLISGNIDIKKHSDKMKLKTISGDIDLFITDATFEAKTLNGEIYSDLDINFDKKRKHSHGHQKIKATINKGTASLELNTISGDIFLRKS